MITNSTSRAQGSLTHQVRNARRVAILLLVAVVPSIGLLAFLAFQSGAWQLIAETVNMSIYGIVILVGFNLIRRKRVPLGMRFILVGMGLGLLALDCLIGGLGVLLGIAASLLITAIATLTLPEQDATPTIIVSFGLGLFIVLLDALLPPYRLTVPALNVYVPVAIVILAAVCIYLVARQFGSYSMRGKLTLTLLLVAILPVILQAAAFTVLAQSRLTSIGQQDLLSSAKQTVSRINVFISDGLLDIRASILLPEVIDLLSAPADKRDVTNVAVIFNALSSKNRYIRSYSVFDTTGIDVFDTSQLNIGTNQLNQPYIQNPLQTRKPYVSDVLFDQMTGEGLLHFSAPVRTTRGDIIGVAQVAYSVAALQDLVVQSSDMVNTGRFGMLFDENYFRLADGSNPNRPPFKLTMPLTPERLAALRDAQRLPEGDLTELTANLPDLERGLRQASQQQFFVAEAGETVENAESREVPDQMAAIKLASRPWLMVFGETQSALLAPVNDLARSSLFLVLAISAVTIFVAARVSRVLAHPIVRLTEAAGKVAQGDLSVRATIDTTDEIGALAVTFNSMTEQLGSMVTTLEDRVQARTDQLRASAEVGHTATAILNPDQLLEQIADLITTRFGFYYTAVFVLDDQNQQAILHAATGEAGRSLLERGHRLPLNEESMVGAAIIAGQPKIALDVGQGAVRFANPLLPNTRSEIALPLRVGVRTLGALDVQSERPGAFDESNTEMLQTMADQIAVALSNAEAFQRSEQQANTLALLNQISRNLATATSLENIAVMMPPILNSLVGQSHFAIVQKTDNPQILALRDFTSDPARPVGDAEPIQATDSLIGKCVERGEVIYTEDLSEWVDQYSDVASFYRRGVRATVFLPLRVGERILGTFNVSTDQAHAYSPGQIAQLEQIASQLAITVENLNLAEQTRQTLAELDAANRRLIGQAWEHYTRAVKLEAAEWRNGAWNVLENPATQPDTSQALVPATPPLRVPIKVRGTTIGEFDITSANARPAWDTEEVTFARSLIDQVGQVLETARLLDETERVAQREKAVADAADKIHRSTDIESVLQSALTELQRITGRHGISVQLGFGRSAQGGSRSPNGDPGGDR